MFRTLLALCIALPLVCATRDAMAIGPEIYGGLGTRTYNVPGAGGDVVYTPTLEAGVDNVFSDYGAGLRLDLPHMRPAVVGHLRYSLFKMPFVRIFGALGGGVEKSTDKGSLPVAWNGTVEAFLGFRASMGLPYLGLDVGGAKSNIGVGSDYRLFSTLTIGLVF